MTQVKWSIRQPFFLLVLAAVVCPLSTEAQIGAPAVSLDQAAAQMADAISHSKALVVLTNDFSSAYSEPPLLGSKLSDDFNAALAKVAHGFQIADRPQESTPPAATSGFSEPIATLIRERKSFATIDGHLWTDGDQLKITVSALAWRKSQLILTITYILPVPEGFRTKADGGTPLPGSTDYPEAGKNGYSTAICLHCPFPPYSDKAAHNKTQGVVELDAIIDPKGHVNEVRVVKGLPDGLTEQATKSVLGWRVTPVFGPDGKLAMVRVRVEVTFQIGTR